MLYGAAYPFLILLYIFSVFVPIPVLNYAVGVVSVTVIALASYRAKGLYFYTGLIFLVSGFVLFFAKGHPWHSFFLQFQPMLPLLALFLVLPFINMLIYVNQFHKTIEELMKQRVTAWDQLYSRASSATLIISNFLNIATIPLVAKSLKQPLSGLPEPDKRSFQSKSLLRSYALALSWSPLDATVSSAISLTGVNFLFVLPIMLILAAGAVAADRGLSRLRYRGMHFEASRAFVPAEMRSNAQKLPQLAAFLLLFVVVVSIVHGAIGQSFLLSIVLVLPLYSLLWSWAFRKTGQYLALIAGGWKEHAAGLSNYFFMFLSASLFVNMVSGTEGLDVLQSLYAGVVGIPFYFYALTAAFFLIASLIGFHPIVSLGVFSVVIGQSASHLPIIPFTVVLVVCSMSTVIYSPFNLSVSLMAKELQINPFRITLWNLGFAIGYIFVGICAALLIDLLV